MNSSTTSSSEAAFWLWKTLVWDSEVVNHLRCSSLRLYAIAALRPVAGALPRNCAASAAAIFRYSRIGSPSRCAIGVASAARSSSTPRSSAWNLSMAGSRRLSVTSSRVAMFCSSTKV